MPRHYTGKQHVSTSEVKKPNGTIYVYERTTWYNPETQKTQSKRRLLGKKYSEDSEIVSTRPKKKPATENTSSESLIVYKKENAMICILQYLSDISGVTKEITAATPNNRGLREKALTLAWYAFATEGRAWTRAENWTQTFLHELPYSYGPITEDIYQDLFLEIGNHEEIKWKVFMCRAEQLGDGELLALDSTTISCNTKTIPEAQKAKDKDKIVKNVYKVVYIYSITARQMVAYALISGHIPDCSTVEAALTQLDALNLKKDIEVVQDNGYATDEDIGEYLHRKRHFITRLEPNRQWISAEVDTALKEIRDGDAGASIIHCDPEFAGKVLKIRHTFPHKRKYSNHKTGKKAGDTEYITSTINVFIYYSTSKKGEDDKEFRQNFENVRQDLMNNALLDEEEKSFSEKYCKIIKDKSGTVTEVSINEEAYRKKLKYNGVLVVIADKEKDIEKGLTKFRSRETIEEGIEGHKGHTGGDTSKTGLTKESLDGELFVEFLANSMREIFRTRLRSMQTSLGVIVGDRQHDLKKILAQENKVKNWIRKKSIVYLIEYFSNKDITVVKNGNKRYEFESNKTARDRLFLEKLGVIKE